MPHDNTWEFWLDNHLSPIIAKWMNDKTGYVFKSSYTNNFSKLDDIEIYQLAKEKKNIVLISKDSDFPQLINKYGSPPKLIYLKIPNCDNKEMFNFLFSNFNEITEQLFINNISIIELY